MQPTLTKAEAGLITTQASTLVSARCIAPDEERLVLLKLVVLFYFTYGVSRGYVYIYLYYLHLNINW